MDSGEITSADRYAINRDAHARRLARALTDVLNSIVAFDRDGFVRAERYAREVLEFYEKEEREYVDRTG